MKRKEVFEECLGWYEAYRRLGFKPEEIFFTVNHGRALMILRSQGLQFAGVCGLIQGSEEEIYKAWKTVAEGWNSTMNGEEMDRIYFKSMPARDSRSFLMALLAKGFVIPKDQEYQV